MSKNLMFITICLLPLYILRLRIGSLPTTLLEILIGTSIFFTVISSIREKNGLQRLLESFKTPLLVPSSILLIVAFVSVWLSVDQYRALGIFRAYFLEPWLLLHFCIYLFKDKPQRIWQALVISGWIVSIPALGQALLGQPFFPDAQHELLQGRVAGFYNSANSVALYLGPLTAVLLGLVLTQRKNKSLFSWVSLVLFILVIFLTQSLGALIALSCTLIYLLYCILLIRKRLHKYIFPSLVSGAIVTTVLMAILLINISRFTPNNELIYPRPYDSTETVRLCLWEGASNLLKQNWLFGVGLNSFPSSYTDFRTCDTELFQYPHNIYLNFWTEIGLIGLFAFIFLISSFIRLVAKSNLNNNTKTILMAFLVYSFIHGLFDVPYFKNDLSAQFWVFQAFGYLLTVEKETTDW